MKILLLALILVFSLTSCYPTYDRKTDGNPSYYIDWLEENGIVDYDKEAAPTGSNIVESAYRLNGIDGECNSRNIRVYYGTKEETNQLVTVFMPDKVGEPNVIVANVVYDVEELKQAIENYNKTTESEVFTVQGVTFITNDIILDEEQLRERYINTLWGGLIINGVTQEINEEDIQDFLFTNLSNPIVYRIGDVRVNRATNLKIYLGLNKNDEYILFSQSEDHNTLKLLYTYSSTVSE